MIFEPIIPIWVMTIICMAFLLMRRKGLFNYIRQIAAVVLIFAINLRPILPDDNKTVGVSTDIDVLFVVDNTISMLAEDGSEGRTRLEDVKEDCRYIVEHLPGASYSVVTFDNRVDLKTPYTIDTNMTTQVIDMLEGQLKNYAQGTSINDVMSSLEKLLDNNRNTYQLVFFISDGEITVEEELEQHKGLEKYIDGGAVLGYGTSKGAPMKVNYYYGDDMKEYLYYYDDKYNEVLAISKIDEQNLKSIAGDLGVDYYHMADRSSAEKIIKDIDFDNITAVSNLENAYGGDTELYFYFVIPLVLIFIYEFIYYRRRIFRKGM